MRPVDLKLRGYAQKESDGSWFAVCIDLNLVAQGDTLNEVRDKLHNSINAYLFEAFTEDQAYFDDLVPRKAPLIFLLKYHWASLLEKMRKITHYNPFCIFTEHLPLVPVVNSLRGVIYV